MARASEILRRLITLGVGVVGMLTCGGLFIVSAFVVPPATFFLPGVDIDIDIASMDIAYRAAVVALCAAFFIVFAFVVRVALAVAPTVKRIVVLRDEIHGGGVVTVTLHAVEQIARRAATTVSGLRVDPPLVRLRKGAWEVTMTLLVLDENSLTDLGAAIQTSVKDALMRHTGIPVRDVSVHTELALANGAVR